MDNGEWYKGKLNSRGNYKYSVSLDEELCEALSNEFRMDATSLNRLIKDALWHYCTCELAGNGHTEGVVRKRQILALEARLSRLERELRIRQEV